MIANANWPVLVCSLCGVFMAGAAVAQVREFGVDVSHYQGSTGVSQDTWNQIFAMGGSFTFIKATEGLTGPDDGSMANNLTRATAAGLLAGVYHYAHPENRPTPAGAVLEADHLLNYAGTAIGPGYLRPVLDLEGRAANLSTAALTDWVIAFSNEIIAQRGAGAAPLVYCTESFANNELDSRLASYDLWLAAPVGSANPMTDDPPNPGYPRATGVFDNWAFWQFGAGSVGDLSAVDVDVAHSEFRPLAGYLIPEPGVLALAVLGGAAAVCSRGSRRFGASRPGPS